MNDRTLVMVMVDGIGTHLTNDEKRAHLRYDVIFLQHKSLLRIDDPNVANLDKIYIDI